MGDMVYITKEEASILLENIIISIFSGYFSPFGS